MPQYDSWLYWLALVLPNMIIGSITIISIIFNYRSSKVNLSQNMIFTQKEKVVDNFIEKCSELIAITDPLVLNSKINEYTPTIIPHSQFMVIMQDLLSIDNKVQTLSSVIKLHTFSIYEESNINEIGEMYSCIDTVQKKVQDLILKLIKLHSSNTEEGAFLRENIRELKDNLERDFSIEYQKPYVDMVVSITSIAKLLRTEALQVKKRKSKISKRRNKQLTANNNTILEDNIEQDTATNK